MHTNASARPPLNSFEVMNLQQCASHCQDQQKTCLPIRDSVSKLLHNTDGSVWQRLEAPYWDGRCMHQSRRTQLRRRSSLTFACRRYVFPRLHHQCLLIQMQLGLRLLLRSLHRRLSLITRSVYKNRMMKLRRAQAPKSLCLIQRLTRSACPL